MTSVSNQLFRGSGFLELDPGVHQLALPELPDQVQHECIAICYLLFHHTACMYCHLHSNFTNLYYQTNHCLTEYTKASISEEILYRPHI